MAARPSSSADGATVADFAEDMKAFDRAKPRADTGRGRVAPLALDPQGIRTKASVCAARGVPEYWVITAADREIAVHREPDQQASYVSITTVGSGATATSPAIPELSLDPADIPTLLDTE